MDKGFWEQPDVVDQFSARDPDHRLVRLAEANERPEQTRVLDLGCAGGRNTSFLAERGFDVWATDASAAMVERTRERLVPLVGDDAARERVWVGRMDDLSGVEDSSIDLVIALGVYHNARSVEEWERSITETARVLQPGGRVLVNQFTPETNLTGRGVHPVAGQGGVYDGLPGGRCVLVDATELDAAFARHGLQPTTRSETVRVETEAGRRVSINALYEKV